MEYSSAKGSHNNGSSKKNKDRASLCFVPMCPSHSTTHPNKLFLTVPQDPKLREKWFKAVQSSDTLSPKTIIRCCEDHFDMEKDVENWVKFRLVGGKLFLKKDVVPHFYECQNRLLKPTPIMIYKEKILQDIEIQCNANSEPTDTDTQCSDHSYASKPHDDHNYCQPVHLRETIETEESEDIRKEEVFSWQKKDSIEPGQDSDDPEDRIPTPVLEKPKVLEDVMTLSMDCDEPESQSVPEEPAAAVVPEDVEDRCKDCEAVVDGFQFYCISCGRGVLCGACAARAPHDDHYLLRAPKDVTKDQTEAVLEAIRQQMLKKDLLTLYETDENGLKVEIKNEPEEPLSSLPEPTEPDQPVLPDPLNTETKTEEPLSPNKSTETNEDSIEPLAGFEEMLSELLVFAEPLDKESCKEANGHESDDSMSDRLSEHSLKSNIEEALKNTIKEEISQKPVSVEALSDMLNNSDSESDEEETPEHYPPKRPRLIAHRNKQNSRGNETLQQQSLELNSNADGSIVMIDHNDLDGPQTVLQLNTSDLRELQSVLHLNSNDLNELQSVLQASSSTHTESQTVLQLSPSDFRELQTVLQQSNSSSQLTESQNVLEVSPNEFTKLQTFLQNSDLTESKFVLQPSNSGLTESKPVLRVSPNEFTRLQNFLQASPNNLTESQTVLHLSRNDVQELQTVLHMNTSDHTETQSIIQVSPNKFTRLQDLLQASPNDLTEQKTVIQISPNEFTKLQNVLEASPSNFREQQTVLQISPSEFTKLQNVLKASPSSFIEQQTVLQISPNEFAKLQANPSNFTEQKTVLQISPTDFTKLETFLRASPSDLTEKQTVLHIDPSDLTQFAQVTPNLKEPDTVLQVSAGDFKESHTVLQVSPSDFRELQTFLQENPNITEIENVQGNSSNLVEVKTIQIMEPFRKKSRNGPSKPKFSREP